MQNRSEKSTARRNGCNGLPRGHEHLSIEMPRKDGLFWYLYRDFVDYWVLVNDDASSTFFRGGMGTHHCGIVAYEWPR